MSSGLQERDAARLERTADRAFKLLGEAAPGGFEAAALENAAMRRGPPDAHDRALIERSLLRHWERRPAPALAGRDPRLEARAIAAQLVGQAQDAMRVLSEDGASAALSLSHTLALESVILTRGRPALRVMDNAIEPLDDDLHPGSGFWRALVLNDHEHALAGTAAAVAAVMVAGPYLPAPATVVGTAWLIGEDLAITNRHVLIPELGLRLARRRPGEPTQARLKSDTSVYLDFAYDDGPQRSLRREIEAVAFISEAADPVDVALLRLKPAAPADRFQRLRLSTDASEWDQDYVYAVGHPGRLAEAPADIAAVFGDPDGRKRVSLGELMDPDDLHPSDLRYDASTIGGFSGGPIVPIRSQAVIGLHYWGGDPRTGNRAIIASALREHAVHQFLPG